MDFETFKQELAGDIKDRLDTRTDVEHEVEIHKVDKMNETYDAITVKPENGSIGVNINATQLFDKYQEGMDYDRIVDQASDMAWNALDNHPDFNLDAITDYSQMKEKLAMEVVSAERNAELLETVPHKNIEDMAVVYRIVLDSSDEGRSSILITNKMLDSYGISAEQLHNDAMQIAPEIRPAVIKGMSEVMAEMMGAEQAEMLGLAHSQDEPMLVATVPDKTQGAGILAYENFMDQAAERVGGDFFILPSSIHEILIVKDDGNFDRAALEQMVKEVNATTVSPEDKLTDSVYHYDSKDRIFELAEKYEARISEKSQEAEKAEEKSISPETGKENETAEPDVGEKPEERPSTLAKLAEAKERAAKQPRKESVNKDRAKGGPEL